MTAKHSAPNKQDKGTVTVRRHQAFTSQHVLTGRLCARQWSRLWGHGDGPDPAAQCVGQASDTTGYVSANPTVLLAGQQGACTTRASVSYKMKEICSPSCEVR